MAKVELKQPIVEEISECIKDAQSVVLVDYRGLTVEQDTNLRRELRNAGVTYKVYKNTLMNFAFKGTECEPLCLIWKVPAQLRFLPRTLRRRPELLQSLQRLPISWRSRAES